MKKVFVAKRIYDRSGFHIVGIFLKNEEAELAVDRDIKNGYGESHSVVELEVGQYFDIDYPDAQ